MEGCLSSVVSFARCIPNDNPLQAQTRRTLTCAQDTSRQKVQTKASYRESSTSFCFYCRSVADRRRRTRGGCPTQHQIFLLRAWKWKCKSSIGNLPASCTLLFASRFTVHTTPSTPAPQGSTTKTVLPIGFCFALSSLLLRLSLHLNPNQSHCLFEPDFGQPLGEISFQFFLPLPPSFSESPDSSTTTSQRTHPQPPYPLSTHIHRGTSNGRAQRRNRACRERHQPWYEPHPCRPLMSQS